MSQFAAEMCAKTVEAASSEVAEMTGEVSSAEVPRYFREQSSPTREKFDDNNRAYLEDGGLKPLNEYELNGAHYRTDDLGRIVEMQAKPTITPENTRDIGAQLEVGGADRRAGDQGGHLCGRSLGGDPGLGNLVPMDGRINQSDYKRMENDVQEYLNAGKSVAERIELSYPEKSSRPDGLTVTLDVEGSRSVYNFDNNIDGSLREKLPEIANPQDVATVDSVCRETGGTISSIKEQFGADGERLGAEARITYRDEMGLICRRSVMIGY